MNRVTIRPCAAFFLALLAALLAGGCSPSRGQPPAALPDASTPMASGTAAAARPRPAARYCEAAGTATFSGGGAVIDYSNANLGYVMVRCQTGQGERLKVLVAHGEEQLYYDLSNDGRYDSYSLTCGDGTYSVTVYANLGGDQYTPVLTGSFQAALADEFAPYLVPNHYVRYDPGDDVLALGSQLAQGAAGDLAVVDAAYQYVISHIRYDDDKAAAAGAGQLTGYVPSPDATLSEQEGICFEYAALFAALLRSQGIPTRLVMGYVQPSGVYHAWNEVYITEIGWVNMQIYFDGTGWKLADTTFAASNGLSDANTYDAIYRY